MDVRTGKVFEIFQGMHGDNSRWEDGRGVEKEEGDIETKRRKIRGIRDRGEAEAKRVG